MEAVKINTIDLHVHSIYSDGTYSPKELVDCALEKGLKAIALTDHDTIDGIEEIMDYAKDKPVEVIPGIEYSTEYNKRDVHIVGLFIDYKAPVFLEYLARFKQSRIDRNHKLCNNLQKAGIDITYEALLDKFPNAVITRAHYAGFLMDIGVVRNRNEAFDRYLGDHTPYFVHREKITPEEVINVTRKAGGIPVLAHPPLYGLGNERLDLLVKKLKEAGLMGIETLYSTYTTTDERQMKALAKKYRLLESGGSDFHGKNKPGIDLGTGYGKLKIQGDFLDNMKKALGTKILFTDLDETLLTEDKKISENTRLKIIKMIEMGNHFVLASGRPINSILAVLEQLGIKEEVIKLQKENPKKTGGIYATAYNGAVLYDCIKGEVIEQYSIPMDIAQKLFDMAAENNIHIQTYTDTNIVSIADDKEIASYTKFIKMGYIVETHLEKVLEHPPFKLIAINIDDRRILEDFKDKVEKSPIGQSLVCAFSNDRYLEFFDKNAGKGNALLNMCKALNVLVQNSVAAGDEENDVSMIEAAGTGVAMVNGNPVLKAKADYVTQYDNNNDGIAEVIEKYFL